MHKLASTTHIIMHKHYEWDCYMCSQEHTKIMCIGYSVHKPGHDIYHTRSHLIIPLNNAMNVTFHQISHYIIPVTNRLE